MRISLKPTAEHADLIATSMRQQHIAGANFLCRDGVEGAIARVMKGDVALEADPQDSCLPVLHGGYLYYTLNALDADDAPVSGAVLLPRDDFADLFRRCLPSELRPDLEQWVREGIHRSHDPSAPNQASSPSITLPNPFEVSAVHPREGLVNGIDGVPAVEDLTHAPELAGRPDYWNTAGLPRPSTHG